MRNTNGKKKYKVGVKTRKRKIQKQPSVRLQEAYGGSETACSSSDGGVLSVCPPRSTAGLFTAFLLGFVFSDEPAWAAPLHYILSKPMNKRSAQKNTHVHTPVRRCRHAYTHTHTNNTPKLSRTHTHTHMESLWPRLPAGRRSPL